MVTKVIVRKSTRPMKKWMAEFDNGRVVHFGATGYQDFTQHKNPERLRLYKIRHGGGRENHGKSGMYTAGFWSMWLLWNKPSLQASARDMERRFGLKISFSSGGASRKTVTKQRTSRKLRTRKMSGLIDKVYDPDVASRILAFLPPSDIRSTALASRSDKELAQYFIRKQPESYFDMNRFRNMIQFRGLLDLTTVDLARRYFDANDSTNSLRAKYIQVGPYVRMTSKDGKKLIPTGVESIEFRNVNVRHQDLEDAKKQVWWDKYFSEDFSVPIKQGELPYGLITILNLDRKLEMDSVPNTVQEITYADGYAFDYNLEFLPESVAKITVPFSGFEDNQDYFNNLPVSLKLKVFVVINTGFRNPYDGEYEEDSEEFTISEAFGIIAEREQMNQQFMDNMVNMDDGSMQYDTYWGVDDDMY